MISATDHPPSLSSKTCFMAVALKSWRSFHLRRVKDLFITSLNTHSRNLSYRTTGHLFSVSPIVGKMGQSVICISSFANELYVSNLGEYSVLSNCFMSAINSLFTLFIVLTFTTQTVHIQHVDILDICLLAQV